MFKEKKIKIPIYNDCVTLIFHDDVKVVMVKYGMLNLSASSDATTCQHTYDDGKVGYVIAFQKPSPSVIAHECFHLLNFMFDHKGISYDRNNDEPGAYLLGYLVNEVHLFIDKCNEAPKA